MSRTLHLYYLSLTTLLLAVATSQAQVKEHVFDSEGTLFWVTFIEGRGGGGETEIPDMRLFLSAVEPTTVTITNNFSGNSIEVDIPLAYTSVEVNITNEFGGGFELGTEDLGLSRKSLKIESEVDITVYGVTARIWSSDGFLALPDDVLTRRYIVLAYPNGYFVPQQTFNPPLYDHPSEFAIIATEDNTEVTIDPTANLNGRPTKDQIKIGLNRGEVYFAQAGLFEKQDVTGTQIRSTKPIAVFSGTRRTSIPTSVANYRDLLVEQMPPLDAWGNTAILTPIYRVNNQDRGFDPVARLVAVVDFTDWTLNGVPRAPLRAGEPIEIVLDETPSVIKADAPILVAQYEHSNQEISQDTFGLGDPFMMIVPPESQYDTIYAFQSVPHQLFVQHFVNVVVETSDVASLRIDGRPVNAQFFPVPGTIYSYAQVELSAGAHTARADSPFGLYAYGFGQANSYGYPGGMLFDGLIADYEPPYFIMDRVCDDVSAVIIDDRITDWGLDSVEIVSSGTSNVTAEVAPFESGADSVEVTARLIDPYQDGDLLIRSVDSGGRSGMHQAMIPGFTVGIRQLQGEAPTSSREAVYNGDGTCIDVEVFNYGQFSQEIDRTFFDHVDGLYRLITPARFSLGPGESRVIGLCFDGLYNDSVLDLRVTIGDTCVERDMLLWQIVTIIDTVGPERSSRLGDCTDGGAVITFSEPDAEFFGIDRVNVVEAVNAETVVTPDDASLPAGTVELTLRQIDPYEDMVYHVEVIDMAGNVATYRDTIAGFTLAAINDESGLQASVRFDREWDADSLNYLGRRCDSVLLRNYGLRTVELDYGQLLSNRDFSIPAAQFPIVVEPGDSVMMALCMEGRRAGEQLDTLVLIDRCGRVDRVPLKTPVDFGHADGVDRCGQTIEIQAFAATKQTFLQTPFPNPSNGERIGVDIGLPAEAEVSIEVLDQSGAVRLRVLNRSRTAEGVHRLSFDPQGLESGAYFCRLTVGDGITLDKQFIIAE